MPSSLLGSAGEPLERRFFYFIDYADKGEKDGKSCLWNREHGRRIVHSVLKVAGKPLPIGDKDITVTINPVNAAGPRCKDAGEHDRSTMIGGP